LIIFRSLNATEINATKITTTQFNSTGININNTFQGDVKIIGTLYGGSPLKIGTPINLTSTTSDNSPLIITNQSGQSFFEINPRGSFTLLGSDNSSFYNGLLFLDNYNARIGINTVNPSSLFEVNGNIELTNLLDNDATNFFDLTGCGTSATFTALDSTGAVTCSAISITESQISNLKTYQVEDSAFKTDKLAAAMNKATIQNPWG